MPVSPQDFELYSRMTGAPMPSDAMSRMQMAPEVYQFIRNVTIFAVLSIGQFVGHKNISPQRRIYNKLLSFSWFCNNNLTNSGFLPYFYPFL